MRTNDEQFEKRMKATMKATIMKEKKRREMELKFRPRSPNSPE